MIGINNNPNVGAIDPPVWVRKRWANNLSTLVAPSMEHLFSATELGSMIAQSNKQTLVPIDEFALNELRVSKKKLAGIMV